ncbi:MAG: hypothetical protein ABIP55_06635 [Tepidisphaeraceae bacterium]
MSWFKLPKASQKAKRLSFEDVVEAYGAVLAECPRGIGMSVPEKLLPFDKVIIKASLIQAAKIPGLPDTFLQHLQVGFLSLADFQPNGGGKSIFAGASELNADDLTKEQINEILEKVRSGGDAEVTMAERIHNERTSLSAEWNEAVRDMPNA